MSGIANDFISNESLSIGFLQSKGATIYSIQDIASGIEMLNPPNGEGITLSLWGDTQVQPPLSYASWDPVQTGSPSPTEWYAPVWSPVLTYTKTSTSLHAVIDVVDFATGLDSQVTLDMWVSLDGPVASIRYRAVYTGTTDYGIGWAENNGPYSTITGFQQECPAILTNAALTKHVGYFGGSPWTNDTLTTGTVAPYAGNEFVPNFIPTEKWIAMVNPDSDFGIGIYSPSMEEFALLNLVALGDGNYTTPLIGHNFSPAAPVLDFTIYLTTGTVEAIRGRFAAINTPPTLSANTIKNINGSDGGTIKNVDGSDGGIIKDIN